MYKALALAVVLMVASPVGALWRQGSGATDTVVTNLNLKPGQTVYWLSTATENATVLDLNACSAWHIRMLEGASGTPVYLVNPQSCDDSSCTIELDMLSSALNGTTALAGAEFLGMQYMQVEIVESSGTGSSVTMVTCNGSSS